MQIWLGVRGACCLSLSILLAFICACKDHGRSGRGTPRAAVEVMPIERGPISLRRTYSGSLEAAAEFVVSAKVGARVERVHVDIGDSVLRGQVVVELEDDEFEQALLQAQAERDVARAQLVESKGALEVAERERKRVAVLNKRGIASDTRLDAARASAHAANAQHQVATAQENRAAALLQGAKVRLAYTRVTAQWHNGEDQRLVAERFVDEGATVAAHAPLISVVDVDPLVGVLFVPERDYSYLAVGKDVALSTDAYPGEHFSGKIRRIAPVFQAGSRQARVEFELPNRDRRLKPGLFVRARVELEQVEDAVLVPKVALAHRDGQTGVFLVEADGEHVAWHLVEVGIESGDTVQLTDGPKEGLVVTLGHQLLEDGTAITRPNALPEEQREGP